MFLKKCYKMNKLFTAPNLDTILSESDEIYTNPLGSEEGKEAME